MTRSIEPRDASPWALMRARLWPHADSAELADEVRTFFSGVSMPALTAVFLAEDDAHEPLGFIELSVRAFADGCDSAPIPHIEGWYVEPSARGNGIGRRLMQCAEGWARERGFIELASDTEIENESSLRAHERCGFAEVERLIKLRKALR